MNIKCNQMYSSQVDKSKISTTTIHIEIFSIVESLSYKVWIFKNRKQVLIKEVMDVDWKERFDNAFKTIGKVEFEK